MLSSRGQRSVVSLDIPWRFAPGSNNRFDPIDNPTGVVVFGNAENELIHPELGEYVRRNVSMPDQVFTYRFSANGGPRFPSAMAATINRFFKLVVPIKPENVFTASALTAVHEMLGHATADPGDGILVSRPIYGRFELDFGNTVGLNIVYADMDGADPFSVEVVPKLQAALDRADEKGVRVAALLIVNPHNPLGRCYTKPVLYDLMAFCQWNEIHLVSDEIYALSVYDEKADFTSVLSIGTTDLIDLNRLHILYGIESPLTARDFGSAGLRLGCLITYNKALKDAMMCNSRFHGPSGPSIEIATRILEDITFVDELINTSHKKLRAAREYTVQQLEEAGIWYDKRASAGLFIYIDLRPWLDTGQFGSDTNAAEYALAQKLLENGVGVHPCEEHNGERGFFRFVFAQPQATLEEGLRRLVRALKANTKSNVAV